MKLKTKTSKKYGELKYYSKNLSWIVILLILFFIIGSCFLSNLDIKKYNSYSRYNKKEWKLDLADNNKFNQTFIPELIKKSNLGKGDIGDNYTEVSKEIFLALTDYFKNINDWQMVKDTLQSVYIFSASKKIYIKVSLVSSLKIPEHESLSKQLIKGNNSLFIKTHYKKLSTEKKIIIIKESLKLFIWFFLVCYLAIVMFLLMSHDSKFSRAQKELSIMDFTFKRKKLISICNKQKINPLIINFLFIAVPYKLNSENKN